MLSKNMVTGTAMKGMGLLEKEASKYGVNLAQGNLSMLDYCWGQDKKDPKITIKPLGTSGKSMQEELKKVPKPGSIRQGILLEKWCSRKNRK